MGVQPLPDGCSQPLFLHRVGSARFGHQHQTLPRHPSPADPECGHTAPPNALDIPRNLLQFLGVEVSSPLDDDVFDPAGDKELSIRQIAQVARLQPAVLQHCRGGLGFPEVTSHDGGAATLNVALGPGRKRISPIADDPDLVSGQRPAG